MRSLTLGVAVFLALAALICACGSTNDAAVEGGADAGVDGGQPDLRAFVDRAAFVDAVLADVFKAPYADGRQLVVLDTLQLFGLCATADDIAAAKRADPVFAEAFEELRNPEPFTKTLSAVGPLGTSPVLLTDAAYTEIFDSADYKASWTRFFERYPNAEGLVQISPLGFTRDGTGGVVWVWNGCGTLCGYGQYHAYRLENGGWVPAALVHQCQAAS